MFTRNWKHLCRRYSQAVTFRTSEIYPVSKFVKRTDERSLLIFSIDWVTNTQIFIFFIFKICIINYVKICFLRYKNIFNV